jgi:hypothetical protein
MRSPVVGVLSFLVACWAPVEPNEHGADDAPPSAEAQCEPGALRCDGALLRICAGDGDEEPVLEVCQSPEACNAAIGCSEVVQLRRGESITIPYAIR